MAASECSDGPVLSLMNKRLRALRKKYNRIIQMEESIAQGKTLNKEQEEVLRSKPSVLTLIDEYEKLRQPLSVAVQEELNLAVQHNQVSATPSVKGTEQNQKPRHKHEHEHEHEHDRYFAEDGTDLEDLLKILYFGSLFDVKPQSDFTSTMLTKTHERGCCLTYDYVTDDSTDLLGEKDLDMISMLGGLLMSRPVHSSLSHKNALRSCFEHATLWLANSDQPIEPGSSITYAGLRERLNKITASDYFLTTPEMKASIEVAAAAGRYHVPVQNESVPEPIPVQPESESEYTSYEHTDEVVNFEGQDVGAEQSSPDEDSPKDGSEASNPAVAVSVQQDQQKSEADAEEQNHRDDSREQQYIPRRSYQNQRGGNRGGGGGRRGYSNGRGGRSSRGGGGYQNGRGQYYDQSGNYYPRNHYNLRGRGGRGPGGNTYNNHGAVAHGNNAHDERAS